VPLIAPRSLDDLLNLPESDWQYVPVRTVLDFKHEVRTKRSEAHARATRILDSADGRSLTNAQERDYAAASDELRDCDRQLDIIDAGLVTAQRGADISGGDDTPTFRDTGPEGGAFRQYLRTGNDVELRAQGIGRAPQAATSFRRASGRRSSSP
jgi:hypothetical protein